MSLYRPYVTLQQLNTKSSKRNTEEDEDLVFEMDDEDIGRHNPKYRDSLCSHCTAASLENPLTEQSCMQSNGNLQLERPGSLQLATVNRKDPLYGVVTQKSHMCSNFLPGHSWENEKIREQASSTSSVEEATKLY